ncbi:MAG: hypothetical protein J6C37_08955 [Roseburia sp.]|nr:hypothetical protein [Roseburia sp.]
MEELLELTRKQLKIQKFISFCLAVMVILLLVVGVSAMKYVGRMTVAVEDAMVTIQELDMESINDSIQTSQEMLGSVEEFSAAVDEVTDTMHQFNDWFSGLFSK